MAFWLRSKFRVMRTRRWCTCGQPVDCLGDHVLCCLQQPSETRSATRPMLPYQSSFAGAFKLRRHPAAMTSRSVRPVALPTVGWERLIGWTMYRRRYIDYFTLLIALLQFLRLALVKMPNRGKVDIGQTWDTMCKQTRIYSWLSLVTVGKHGWCPQDRGYVCSVSNIFFSSTLPRFGIQPIALNFAKIEATPPTTLNRIPSL